MKSIIHDFCFSARFTRHATPYKALRKRNRNISATRNPVNTCIMIMLVTSNLSLVIPSKNSYSLSCLRCVILSLHPKGIPTGNLPIWYQLITNGITSAFIKTVKCLDIILRCN